MCHLRNGDAACQLSSQTGEGQSGGQEGKHISEAGRSGETELNPHATGGGAPVAAPLLSPDEEEKVWKLSNRPWLPGALALLAMFLFFITRMYQGSTFVLELL